MKLAASVTIFLLVHLKAITQEDFIKWNKDVKIVWSDFKGQVDKESLYAVMSAVGFYYKYNSASNGKVYKIHFAVEARFDRTKSWSKKSLRTAAILKHEQLHFDIAELIGRSFKEEAERTEYTRRYKDEINRIFNRYSLFLQQFQRKYDVQTAHSNNKAKQREWERLIHQELLK